MAPSQRRATPREPDKHALVFELGEFTSLPNFVRVCRDVAKCPARHRPAEEYLRWTFIIVHDRWCDELKLPAHDPSIPKEADGDLAPGIASGLYDLLGPLPGWNAIVPPVKGQVLYFVEEHVELSVADVAGHLRERGFEIVRADQLLATREPPREYDSSASVHGWLEDERAAFQAAMSPADADVLAFIRGDTDAVPHVAASAALLQRCPAPNRHPASWNAYDRRIAEVLVRSGAAERLLLGMTTPTWEAPEPSWHDAMVDAMTSFGMDAAAARERIALHVLREPNLGLSDALWVLVRSHDLRACFAGKRTELADVERGIKRAQKEIGRVFGLEFPRDVQAIKTDRADR
jgi:hypothetical protein